MRLNLFSSSETSSAGGPRAQHIRPVLRIGRRLLAALGPSFRASPARRLVQCAALGVFLLLLFVVCWPYGAQHHADAMRAREFIEAEAFLALDPLVSISTALAAKAWVWSLAWAGILLVLCLFFPRGFCGYLCPLGTLLDVFDWAIGSRATFLRVKRRGWWVHLKYYLLLGTLVGSLCGVLLSGFVAAIAVVTRGLVFVLGPVQLGIARGWYLVPPMNAGHYLSIALFLLVFGLGFLGRRFWCRHVCPTGAIFSVASLLRLSERKVKDTCSECGACRDECAFGAITEEFSTRVNDCSFCQTCGGICPSGAIEFRGRRDSGEFRERTLPADSKTGLTRRGFAAATLGGAALALGLRTLFGARLEGSDRFPVVRPPGSVPEHQFLRLCVRCGECYKACPFNVLHPLGFEQGIEGLWTPRVVADWSGCDPTCTNCGQVCPTAAIRPLPLEEKRVARMALAAVNERTCLPHAGREECQLCVDECKAAGYDAIEFIRVRVSVDAVGQPIEDTGYLAPAVVPERCVGCGLCQARCHAINVKEKTLLKESAVQIAAGAGKEDRLLSGSYRALREEERKRKEERKERHEEAPGHQEYLPDFLK